MSEAPARVLDAFESAARIELVERETPAHGTVLDVDGADAIGQVVAWPNGYVEVVVLDTVSGAEAVRRTFTVGTRNAFLEVLDGFVRALQRVDRARRVGGYDGAG